MAQHNGSTAWACWLIVSSAVASSFAIGCNATSSSTTQPSPVVIAAAGTCEDPVRLDGSATLDNQSTLKATDTVSGDNPTCVGYKTHGADQVYALTLPGSDTTRLRVSVTPTTVPGRDGFDPVVYVTAGCSVLPECMAGADSYGAGSAETVEHVRRGRRL
jgi:hypothetical protein